MTRLATRPRLDRTKLQEGLLKIEPAVDAVECYTFQTDAAPVEAEPQLDTPADEARMLRLELRLARLDREWEEARRTMRVTEGQGPSVAIAMLTGVVFQGVCGSLTSMVCCSVGALAVAGFVLGVLCLYVWDLQERFRRTQEAYRERRKDILAQLHFAGMR